MLKLDWAGIAYCYGNHLSVLLCDVNVNESVIKVSIQTILLCQKIKIKEIFPDGQ